MRNLVVMERNLMCPMETLDQEACMVTSLSEVGLNETTAPLDFITEISTSSSTIRLCPYNQCEMAFESPDELVLHIKLEHFNSIHPGLLPLDEWATQQPLAVVESCQHTNSGPELQTSTAMFPDHSPFFGCENLAIDIDSMFMDSIISFSDMDEVSQQCIELLEAISSKSEYEAMNISETSSNEKPCEFVPKILPLTFPPEVTNTWDEINCTELYLGTPSLSEEEKTDFVDENEDILILPFYDHEALSFRFSKHILVDDKSQNITPCSSTGFGHGVTSQSASLYYHTTDSLKATSKTSNTRTKKQPQSGRKLFSTSVKRTPKKVNKRPYRKSKLLSQSVRKECDEDEGPIFYSSEFILREGLKRRPGINPFSGKPYVCPVPGCDKVYKNPNGIKYHARYGHSARQEFPCFCGKIYSTRHGLMAHRKIHETLEEKKAKFIKRMINKIKSNRMEWSSDSEDEEEETSSEEQDDFNPENEICDEESLTVENNTPSKEKQVKDKLQDVKEIMSVDDDTDAQLTSAVQLNLTPKFLSPIRNKRKTKSTQNKLSHSKKGGKRQVKKKARFDSLKHLNVEKDDDSLLFTSAPIHRVSCRSLRKRDSNTNNYGSSKLLPAYRSKRTNEDFIFY